MDQKDKPGAPEAAYLCSEQEWELKGSSGGGGAFTISFLGLCGFKTLMKQIKVARDFYECGAVCAREMCLLAGCGREEGEKKKKKDLIFMSHRGLYGGVNPGVLCGGWRLGRCQFGVEMSSYQAQHMHNDLFISPRTLSLCLSPASISICVCRLARTHPSSAHVPRVIQVSALSSVSGGVNRKSGGEGRQRGRVLAESGEGAQMNRDAAVKCSD